MRPASSFRRFFCLIIIAVCCSRQSTSLVQTADLSDEVQARIKAVENGLIPKERIKGQPLGQLIARMYELHIPGVSVAVINNFEIEWAKGYGLADAAKKSPVTVTTRFQAASLSKPVAAMAALTLVEEGKLDLDRNVNEQLKSWKVPENEFTREHPVDLRGILSHTAGLTVHGFGGYSTNAAIPTLPQILDGVTPANSKPVRVDKVPGKGYRYSGGGTTVMQQLLIDVTGQSFPEIMRERVLAPLSMTSSTYEQPLPKKLWGTVATAHDRQGKPLSGHWHVYPEMAAAGLWTTPSDLSRYVIEIQRAHEEQSSTVLSHKMVEEMLTPQGGGDAGLGPHLQGAKGARYFQHGGSNAGFTCKFIGSLDRGQGAVVMTNSDLGGELYTEIINGVAAVYDWPDFLPREKE